MSEYQYYEFQALDQPLTPDAQAAMRNLSSRVKLTATSASFVYNYGDFPGDPAAVLAQYFDIMLYITNWGSRQLIFRFPRQSIPLPVQTQYTFAEGLEWSQVGNHTILNMEYHSEEGGWPWIEGEGLLAGILPVRAELLHGDLRALYLVWLFLAQDEADFLEDDEDFFEPSVPPNLQELSSAQKNLMAFFNLSPDLVAAAARVSPVVQQVDMELDSYLDQLSEAEKHSFLQRLLRGEAHLQFALAARLREFVQPLERSVSTAPRRSIRQIVAESRVFAEQRQAEQRRKSEIKRLQKLEQVALHEPELWAQLPGLIAQKQAKPYDDAIKILCDLQALAIHQQRAVEFKEKIIALRNQYPTLRGLHDRMKKAKLL